MSGLLNDMIPVKCPKCGAGMEKIGIDMSTDGNGVTQAAARWECSACSLELELKGPAENFFEKEKGKKMSEESDREKLEGVEIVPCPGFPESCDPCPFGREKGEKACRLGVTKQINSAQDELANFQAAHLIYVALVTMQGMINAATRYAEQTAKKYKETAYMKALKEAASLALAQHEIRLKEAGEPLLEALCEKHADEEKE